MNQAKDLVSTQKRTNVRTAVSPTIRLTRLAFETISPHLPGLASEWAETLFMTPGRYRLRERERYALSTAHAFELPFRFGSIKAWSWGEGPVVILVHGWGGAGAQLACFAPSLVSAGFKVVTYDAPAHGESAGRRASLPLFAETLLHVGWHVGAPFAVVAHSMGAPATALAMRAGLEARRAVFIGPPADMGDVTHRFARALHVPESIRAAMAARIESRFGVRLAELNLPATAAELSARAELLVVHDRRDREVPWQDGAQVAAAWPGAKMLTTEGLGHQRVLRDAGVIASATDFVAAPRTPASGLSRASGWPGLDAAYA